MAKVIFEFEIGEDDELIRIHQNARALHGSIDDFTSALRTKLKHAPNSDELKKWIPLAKLFKEHVSSDHYNNTLGTDYGFDDEA